MFYEANVCRRCRKYTIFQGPYLGSLRSVRLAFAEDAISKHSGRAVAQTCIRGGDYNDILFLVRQGVQVMLGSSDESNREFTNPVLEGLQICDIATTICGMSRLDGEIEQRHDFDSSRYDTPAVCDLLGVTPPHPCSGQAHQLTSRFVSCLHGASSLVARRGVAMQVRLTG